MIIAKELKGNPHEPNADKLLNEFFETLGERDQLIEMHYSTAVVPIKKDGAVQYTVVSSILVMYDAYEPDDDEE